LVNLARIRTDPPFVDDDTQWSFEERMGTMRVIERRLGRRHEVPRVTISWRVGQRRRMFSRTATVEAHLVNVSATGAAILAPVDPDLGPRSRLDIEWDGARATVEIRRVEEGPVPGISLYGVAFGVRDADFDHLLDSYIASQRPSSVEAMRASEHPDLD
jgi:hypothetical protein